ncbi:restnol dehydrogenase-like protein [Dermatophagoides farinae]|uniref:Restnol dehydrogenase-like protein n=1 Tax=Dermatophagoides farinae TaxID=6954 RepID=A0A9D4SGP1_DERFA|nr:restnol dehydrogenase-like protein [Dermatophagoides farinae]
MLSFILTAGFVSLTSVIIGVRLYNVYYCWGNYEQMLKRYGRKSIKNLTIVITGCNTGIGKETARELYRHGARVIMANRNRSQTEQVIQEFRDYIHLLMGNCNEPRLDILISNAAVFGAPVGLTDDHFETNMQVNHLAPALLTHLLLPKLQQPRIGDHAMKKSPPPPPRIITVTSTLTNRGTIQQEFLSRITNEQQLKTIMNKRGREIYASTKLANLHFMRSLSTRKNLIKNVEICLASPGFCYTRLHRYSSRSSLIWMSLFAPLFFMIVKSSKQGAQTIIGCSMIPHLRSDVLYHHCKEDELFFQKGPPSFVSNSHHLFEITMKSIEPFSG